MLASKQSTLQVAIEYVRRGWRVVPIPPGTKAPKINGWPSLHITADQVPQYFDRTCNIGVILTNVFVDLDLDCLEAIDLAPEVLPVTTAIFGRESKRESHWLYTVKGDITTAKFVDPLNGKMLLELRANGLQTVFPGSIHPSGEPVEWDDHREPSIVEGAWLLKSIKLLAALSLGKRYCNEVVDEASLLNVLEKLDQRIADQIRNWLDLQPNANGAPSLHHNNGAFLSGPLPTHLVDRPIKSINLDHLNPTFRPEPILAGCAQMQRLRDDAANQSRDSWWHCLGTLAFCEGGDPIAHQLSSGHPKYSFAETQRELDGWRAKADGASLCETFDRKSPGVCGTCPHRGKINSPIILGISQPTVTPATNGARPASAVPSLTPNILFQVPTGPNPSQKQKAPGPKEKLLRIGSSAELWHDKDRVAYATVAAKGHRENFAVKSQAFRDWLLDEYGKRHRFSLDGESYPDSVGEQQIKDAINSLAAKARSGPEYQPAVRVAEEGTRIYIDLGTHDWSAAEISADGWQIVSAHPVRFLRPAGLLPLPVPLRGGDIRELRHFLNVTDNDFVLIVAWLLGAFRPIGPYPILIVNGQHGSGKSVLCRLLRQSVDPNSAALRGYPKDERDLLLAAKNGWVLVLDNLSGLKGDLSDILCRIATKAAFSTRRLYSDDEEILIEVWRPILLNGIPPLAARGDLASRSIVLELPTLPESDRRSEQEFWSAFDGAAPRLLGALLNGVSGALRNLHSVKLQTRMMDFANWAEAGWRSFGLPPGVFEDIYAQNGAQAGEDALDADPLALSILKLTESKPGWTGTATELLSALMPHAPGGERDRYWPKDATRLRGNLNRLSPLLRQRGLEIEFTRERNSGRNRLISFRKIDKK